MSKIKKVIGYLRVSTEIQDTERQKRQIELFCDKHNYSIVELIEEKVSGAKTQRVGLNKLLQRTNEDADIVIVSEQSRFSREKNIVTVLTNISAVLENGLDLIFLDNPGKIYNAGEVLELPDIIMLVAGAYSSNVERDKITYRMKSGKESMFYNNPYTSFYSIAPFGFKIINNPEYEKGSKQPKRIITIDEKESKVLKEMFDLYVNHNYTYEDISTHLSNNGYTMNKTTINYIFHNKLYIGERYYNNKLIHKIEPIIDKEVFEKVSFIASNNALYNDKSHNVNPLKGLVKCKCGASLYTKNKHDYYVYACIGRAENKTTCDCFGINKNYLIHIIKTSLQVSNTKIEYKVKSKEQINKYSLLIDNINDSIDTHKNELSLINGKIDNLIDLISGEINKDIKIRYESKLKQLVNDEKDKKNLIESLNNKKAEYIKAIESLSNDRSNIKDLTDEEIKEIAKQQIEVINYYSIERYKAFVQVNYKNGVDVLYMVKKKATKTSNCLYELPQSFKFNPDINKVEVEVMKPSNEMSFSFIDTFEVRQYSFDEIIDNYNLDEWSLMLILPYINLK